MKALYAYLISLLIVLADHATKWLATDKLDYARPIEILPVLDMMLIHNQGAAFSFLSDAGGWQRWFFAGIAVGMSVVLVVWLAKLPRNKTWLATCLALVLGGAVGNLIDRVRFGYVVDFISVHWESWYFPAFNVADIAISVGAFMLAIEVLFLDKEDGNGGSVKGSKEDRTNGSKAR